MATNSEKLDAILVSNAELKVHVDNLKKQVTVAVDDIKEATKISTDVQVVISALIEKDKSQDKCIEALTTRINGWSVINSIGVLVATILGITKS